MSIRKETTYRLVCDDCGLRHPRHMQTKRGAEELARDYGWEVRYRPESEQAVVRCPVCINAKADAEARG